MKPMVGAKGPKFYGNGVAPKCDFCDKPATHTGIVKTSWFRGDDARGFCCPEHLAQAEARQ